MSLCLSLSPPLPFLPLSLLPSKINSGKVTVLHRQVPWEQQTHASCTHLSLLLSSLPLPHHFFTPVLNYPTPSTSPRAQGHILQDSNSKSPSSLSSPLDPSQDIGCSGPFLPTQPTGTLNSLVHIRVQQFSSPLHFPISLHSSHHDAQRTPVGAQKA